jgi:hypothetical protein
MKRNLRALRTHPAVDQFRSAGQRGELHHCLEHVARENLDPGFRVEDLPTSLSEGTVSALLSVD